MALQLYHDTYLCTGEDASEMTGKPRNIVLLHGWGMNSLIWDELIPLLLQRFNVTIIDLPGLGRSPMPGGDYDLDYLVKHVLDVAPKQADYIGWSLGGLILQKICQQHPERVEQCYFIAATPKFVTASDWPLAMPEKVYEKFYQLLLEDWQGTLIRFLTLQCKGSESIKADVKKLKEYLFHYGLPAEKALREGLKILQDVDFRSELKTIDCPMHFLLGEFDTLVPAKLVDVLQQQKNIKTHVIKGASHVPHLSHAPQVWEVIEQALLETL